MGTQEGHMHLCWDQFQTNIKSSFQNVRSSQNFCDVTLVSEDGDLVEAHRVILTVSSKFLQNILSAPTAVKHPHPFIYLSGVKSEYLNSVLDFMYSGEAYIAQENLYSFLEVAKILQVKGLIEAEKTNNFTKPIMKNSWPVKEEKLEIVKENSEENEMNTHIEEVDSKKFDTILNDKIDKTHQGSNILPMKSRPKNEKFKEDMFFIHNDKILCKVCDFLADDVDEIKEHIESHMETFEYLQVRKRKHRSEVWNFATKIDSDTAKCTLCDKAFSCFRGTTSNIHQHLATFHGKIINGFKVDNQERKKKKSAVWNFATKGENSATCKICNKTFIATRGTTTNIMMHIKTKHKDEVIQYNLSRTDFSEEKSFDME